MQKVITEFVTRLGSQYCSKYRSEYTQIQAILHVVTAGAFRNSSSCTRQDHGVLRVPRGSWKVYRDGSYVYQEVSQLRDKRREESGDQLSNSKGVANWLIISDMTRKEQEGRRVKTVKYNVAETNCSLSVALHLLFFSLNSNPDNCPVVATFVMLILFSEYQT